MKITIQGQDYAQALDAAQPFTIERRLNECSQCNFRLALQKGGNLTIPVRNDYVTISSDDGVIYFTGYVVRTPLPEYAGVGLDGPFYRVAIAALSDEVLLDQLQMPATAGITGETVGSLMSTLVAHTGATTLATGGVSANLAIGNFVPEHGATWGESAKRAANMARVAYRALDGILTMVPIQSVIHSLNEDDGSLNPANLTLARSMDRLPANDVTLCGEREPVAYVTEYICGDGVTSAFYLGAAPYSLAASKSTIIRELFNEPEIDTRIWANAGGPGYFSVGAGGLAMCGGNGTDGQTVLNWLDPVEMGGTLLLEAAGISLAAGSAGIIAGLFEGGTDASSCTVGFQVMAQQGTGNVTLQPLVQGIPTGTAYSAKPSNQYTLRLRIYSPECNRALAIYRSSGDSGAVAAGGGWNFSPGKLQLEVQEFVNGVGGMPVTIYDGAVASLPGTCTLVAASSVNLMGSIRAIRLTNLGSGWVVSTLPSGGAYPRRLGSPAEGGECELQSSGKLQFQTGFAPAVGEVVAVSYRTSGRAVGRAVNTADQQSLTQAGLPAVSSWVGSVTEPQARCSADCRNAALVTVETSATDSGLLSGTYKGSNFEFTSDVWPGDALLLNATSAGLESQVVVRDVKVSYRSSLPDLFEYGINFANDWAKDLAIKRSVTVPEDTWLPAPAAPTVLPNLNGLAVTTVNGTTVVINTGATPPAGGGFEVRRQDFEFMAGTDPGLVTRSSVPNITFSRESANDRFYIRMYDGATPPNYSEFSTALFINLPLAS
jgi:hypothetical protein